MSHSTPDFFNSSFLSDPIPKANFGEKIQFPFSYSQNS